LDSDTRYPYRGHLVGWQEELVDANPFEGPTPPLERYLEDVGPKQSQLSRCSSVTQDGAGTCGKYGSHSEPVHGHERVANGVSTTVNSM
jgi:hypothetical protein